MIRSAIRSLLFGSEIPANSIAVDQPLFFAHQGKTGEWKVSRRSSGGSADDLVAVFGGGQACDDAYEYAETKNLGPGPRSRKCPVQARIQARAYSESVSRLNAQIAELEQHLKTSTAKIDELEEQLEDYTPESTSLQHIARTLDKVAEYGHRAHNETVAKLRAQIEEHESGVFGSELLAIAGELRAVSTSLATIAKAPPEKSQPEVVAANRKAPRRKSIATVKRKSKAARR